MIMKLYQSLSCLRGHNSAYKMRATQIWFAAQWSRQSCVSPVKNERDSRRMGMERNLFPVASLPAGRPHPPGSQPPLDGSSFWTPDPSLRYSISSKNNSRTPVFINSWVVSLKASHSPILGIRDPSIEFPCLKFLGWFLFSCLGPDRYIVYSLKITQVNQVEEARDQ